MAWTLCSSGAALLKAGANAPTIAPASDLDKFSDESEGSICAETRKDWIANPPSANFSGAVADVVSSHIANKIINYKLSNYPTRTIAQTMLDVNSDIIRKGIAFLKEKEVQEKM